MEKKQWVKDLVSGKTGPVHDLFGIASAVRAQTRYGQPYWNLTLSDKSGKIPGRMWSPASLAHESIPDGSIAEVQGKLEDYQGQPQIIVSALRLLNEDEPVNRDDFMRTSKRPTETMLRELEELAGKVFEYEPWRRFMAALFADPEIRSRMLTAPAAKAMHHAWEGGWLEHTLSVARLSLRLADHYPQLDRQCLLAGAIVHDIGKLWELSGGVANDYTTIGSLMGHIEIGMRKITPLLESSGLEEALILHLQHLVLSHHGSMEFGSPCLPQTAEALALHFADDMDAKMEQFRSALETANQSDLAQISRSPRQQILKRCIYQLPQTPASQLDDVPF